ncbi:two component transcriptional regulator, LuxR family [Propionispira arboris]|uniref:Two component transcriptional regulator, LuxR family n=1 Tax=Propionispira arboris TaxID=84035 RepID=A0A1H6UWV0_9FIRM|nr:response regulator transcription factor [Propionispira arboris]SEI96893.1 two component transcriptional regulator, LuxR family [Propionispira arboris]
MQTNIMIVDDQLLFREGLKAVLDLEESINVISAVGSGKEALLGLDQNATLDLVLLDIRMPEMNGVETVKLIKENYPELKVLMLTTFNDEEYIMEALANGANGYVLKDIEIEKLVEAIHDAIGEKMILPPSVASKLAQGLLKVSPPKKSSALAELELSEREKEIAIMLTQGFSNKQIAIGLFISEGTVRNYISNIYSKIGVNDRTNAVIFLKSYGL